MQPFAKSNPADSAAKSAAATAVTDAPRTKFRPMAEAVSAPPAKDESIVESKRAAAHGCAMDVKTVEKDGVVQKIIVTCSCGEVTEIECLYG